MAQISLLNVPAPTRSATPRPAARTTYRHGRPVRRRRGPGLVGLVLAALLAGGLATQSDQVHLSRLLGAGPAEDISVVVLDGSGAQVAATGADEEHWTASLAKLFVVQQLLERDEAGTLVLDQDDLAAMQRAVELSDDQAMNALWTEFGGAQLVTAAAGEYGLDDTAAPERAGKWGETTTTAADYATFLAHLGAHLSPADLATLTTWMQSTTPTAADGFGQSFGLLSAQADTDGAVAAKQGWMCCLEGTRQLHSTGVLTDGRVVVLMGEFDEDTTWAQATTALTDTAEAVVEGH